MPEYDFLVLQPNEFEHLTRDLLQKKEKVFVESFTAGRDGGIDLRYAKVGMSNIIVQAKRYRDFKTLRGVLSKEASKVKTIRPDRYILSTSVGLTPDNKTEILELLSPFIQSTSDILGRDDLNNLLGQYPEIEKQYYKLWLGSTVVLEDILNKRINNWTSIELDSIRREVSTYVMNDSFNSALNILTTNRYVIISGIPGIGKTTLARMLVYYLLSKGYEEFVKLWTIEDAAQKLTTGKKQVFLYDDFLGSTSFQRDEKGFDYKLVAFIERVKHEPDKFFILCTREYILAEAKHHFEIFSTSNIELAKCVLDLSSYSEAIRAEILYNHLAMAELPLSYIEALLAERRYLKLIKHDNFNPRIIETFLNKRLYQQVDPADFVAKFIDFFNRPLSVWELAFRQLTPIARYSLMVRMSMGEGSVFLPDWYKATKHFVQGVSGVLRLTLDDQIWRETLKVIEGTFIQIKRQNKHSIVSYQNPSVYDFIVDMVSGLNDTQEWLVRESYFAEQLYKPFSDKGFPSYYSFGRIKLDRSIWPSLEVAYRRHVSDAHYCSLLAYGIVGAYELQTKVDFIYNMVRSFPVFFREKPALLSNYVTQDLLESQEYSLRKRMRLIDVLPEEVKFGLDLEHLTETVMEEASSVDDYVYTIDLLACTEIGQTTLESDEFLRKVETALNNELESADSENECDRIKDCMLTLAEKIPYLDASAWEDAIDEKLSGLQDEPEVDDDFSDDYYTGHIDPKDQYEEMFTSLLDPYNLY